MQNSRKEEIVRYSRLKRGFVFLEISIFRKAKATDKAPRGLSRRRGRRQDTGTVQQENERPANCSIYEMFQAVNLSLEEKARVEKQFQSEGRKGGSKR